MDGSDDYFGDDDFVLDETTLAVLDLEEQKWQQQQQTQAITAGQRRPVSQEAAQPAQKRRKTSHETTPEGLIPQLRAVSVSRQSYDEDLPDISIIGDGSYNLPAAQRALAAQARQAQAMYARTLNPQPQPPPRVPAHPPRAHVPAPAPPALPQRRASSGSGSVAFGSGQSQGQAASSSRHPQQRNRLPRQHSTLSSVQAALANFVPPASNILPAPTVPAPASRRGPPSRGSPAPGPSRLSPAAPAARPTIRTPSAPPRATRGASPSLPPPPRGRRPSLPIAGPSRPRRASPSVPPPPHSQVQSHPQPTHQPPLTQGQSERNLRIEVETLRAQIEELSKAQQKAQSQLEEALNVRYAKEGEVSILRKSIEKAAKDHAAEVARIKSAKEEAEAMQVQIRKEMREELERVKTQYLFKQHELETTTRKTPWSSKIRRTDNPPPTPVSAGTQKQQVVEVEVEAETGTEEQQPMQTPSRPSAASQLSSTSPKRRKKVVYIPETPPPRPAKLRGFFNAFDPAPSLSQAVQSTQVERKGKERAKPKHDFSEVLDEDLFFNPPPSTNEERLQETPTQPSSSAVRESDDEDLMREDEVEKEPQLGSSQPASSAEPVVEPESQDVEMQEGEETKEDEEKKKTEKAKKEKEPSPQPDPYIPVDPLLIPDWTRELERMILTHRHRTLEQTTLQILIDYELPDSASSEKVKAYSTQILQLLDVLGTFVARPPDFDHVAQELTRSLCSLGYILCETQSILPLADLVNMLKMLALMVGPFVPAVLAPSGDPRDADSPPEILEFLTTVIRSMLNPRKHEQGEHMSALAAECLGLLEAITWCTPSDLVMRLTYVICAPEVVDILADPKHPIWITQRTTRVFALLATYKDLHRHLLTLEKEEEVDADVKRYRMPYLEKLALMLVDNERNGPEFQPLRQSIIYLFSVLVSHDDSITRAILLHSGIILPSIIHFSHYLTNPLYEDDEEFMDSPQLVSWSIDMMAKIIPLLRRILKDTEFEAIRLWLVNMDMNPRKKAFSGLFHMFTVSLGRVGYAAAPMQLSDEDYEKLDGLHSLAKSVLEFVVDGPEMELIWEAFHSTGSPKARRKRRKQQQTQSHAEEDEEEEG